MLSANPGETALPDSTYRHYDASGNVTWGEHKGWGTYFNGGTAINHITLTRNYYGADQKLRVVQVHDETTNGSTWTQDGSFAEYRYDPLGRRIMERTRRDSVCFNTSHDCASTLTRFVWAGDQLLWELRVPGGNHVPPTSTGLESTSATGDFFGRVSYFHAGGIDKPLLITKEGVESVVPRETWRGQFHKGTSPTTGAVRDCAQGGQTGCLLIAWPGMQTNAAHSWGEESPDLRVWYGGLVDGMRDASGQMYMRNRYYDPATGQFTQTDPIGLAGGMNAYGFAAGDPVSYSDPYGLKIKCNPNACAILRKVLANARHAATSDDAATQKAGQAVIGMISELHASPQIVTLTGQNFGGAHRWGRKLVGDPFNATDATGPCRRRDRYCPTGREAAASRVDLEPPPFSAVGAETRAVHELGHAYEHVIRGLPWSGDSDQKAVDHENNYRRVKGCDPRASHEPNAVNPPCMDN